MKTYTVEIEQRGRATAHVYAESEADARRKVNALIEAQALQSDLIQEWDEENILVIDELTDGFDKDQAKENEANYQEIKE